MGAGERANQLPVLPVGSANERPDDGHVTSFGGTMDTGADKTPRDMRMMQPRELQHGILNNNTETPQTLVIVTYIALIIT